MNLILHGNYFCRGLFPKMEEELDCRLFGGSGAGVQKQKSKSTAEILRSQNGLHRHQNGAPGMLGCYFHRF